MASPAARFMLLELPFVRATSLTLDSQAKLACVKYKALFLDRDGVINIDLGYVHSRSNFHFREGVFGLCLAAQALDYLLVVVTNQAGIARGYSSEAEFLGLTEWMLDRFAEQRIQIARVYYCPYHPIEG